MSSTSKKNNPGNYYMEQKAKQRVFDHKTYLHAPNGQAHTNHLPGDGLLSGSVARSKLCTNYTDVESNLLGIGSSNLVKPLDPVQPQFNNIQSLNISTKVPLYVPATFKGEDPSTPSSIKLIFNLR